MTIGLEVHAQLLAPSKLFCPCPGPGRGASEQANARTCPVCLGYPGELPVLQPGIVALGAQVVLGLGGRLSERSRFDRKSYAYPDLPRGYQITQQHQPLGLGGTLEFEVDGGRERVGIERVHLEEDAGRLSHLPGGAGVEVDFDRAGVPLAEIVTRPELRSPAAARACLEALRRLLLYLGVCGGDMAAGQLRCDANLSLAPPGGPPGTRCEIKNLNSFRHLQRALEYEGERQARLLAAGQPVAGETRLWDEAGGRTRGMRGKEGAADYRYQVEPDLPPLELAEEWVEARRRELPELPLVRRDRLESEYGLRPGDARVIADRPGRADYFEAALAAEPVSPRRLCAWLTTELLGRLGDCPPEEGPVPPGELARLVARLEAGDLGGPQAKRVLDRMVARGEGADAAAGALGVSRIADAAILSGLVRQVLEAHPELVEDYRAGRTKVMGYLMGQVMKASKGAADPGTTRAILEEELA